jgi:ABC-type uncharacterized transport system permease subunit
MTLIDPVTAPVAETPARTIAAATSNWGLRRAALEEAVLPPLVALLLAAVVGDALILSFGQSPGAVFTLLLEGTWGNAYGFGQVLYKATTLVFTGLAVGLGLRAGLFNIGAESQLAAGGFCAAIVGMMLPAGIPSLLCLPIFLLAAALGGGIVGAVPGVLKARFGAHEVIVTIMLNYVAFYLIAYMLRTPKLLQAPGSSNPKSPGMKETAVFPHLLGPTYNLTLGFVFVIIATIYVWYLLSKSSLGFKFRAIGENPHAALVAGINVKNMYVYAMLISGALIGLAGANQVQGAITTGFGSGIDAGIGFDAITVALLGRSRPWGVFVAGILFGAFKAGGFTMQASQNVPIDIVLVVQSLIVLFIAAPPLVRAVFRLPTPALVPRVAPAKISGKKAVVTK